MKIREENKQEVQIYGIPRSKLVDRRAEPLCFSDRSKPLSMLSIAVTFCLLACRTLSRLRSVPLLRDFACERSNPEERDAFPEVKLALLFIATIAEVPYPGGFDVADG